MDDDALIAGERRPQVPGMEAAPSERHDEGQAGEPVQRGRFWRWLAEQVPGTAARRERLLSDLVALNRAIKDAPDSPANFMLRGEIYLRLWYNQRALADFQMARQLAADEMETRRWGLIAQAVGDRAAQGARTAERRLRRHRSAEDTQATGESGDSYPHEG